MPTRYVTGDTVTLGNTFSVAGTPTDPTSTTLTLYAPDGTTTTPALTHVSTGVYSVNVTASSNGIWRGKWEGTGAAPDVEDFSFTVVTPADLRLYASLEEIKGRLTIGQDTVDVRDDLALDGALRAACRQIDKMCGVTFWRDPSTVVRTFTPYDSRCLDLTCDGTVPGIATSTGVVVKLDNDDTGSFETTLTVDTDYILRPTNAAVQVPARPYTELFLPGNTYWFQRSMYGRDTVQVTAKWGWPQVPDEIHEAAIVQTIHLFKSGKDAQTGALFFAGGDAVGALRVSQLHPIARGLIGAYQRPLVG